MRLNLCKIYDLFISLLKDVKDKKGHFQQPNLKRREGKNSPERDFFLIGYTLKVGIYGRHPYNLLFKFLITLFICRLTIN